jgi:signal transduction histidine kinase
VRKLQEFFAGALLARTVDPFERAKVILCFRFTFVYLLMSLPSVPFGVAFQRYDILALILFLLALDVASLLSLRSSGGYRASVALISSSAFCSALGYSAMSSFNLSVIIFVWPIICSVFISFTLGNRASFVYIAAVLLLVTAISGLRISGISEPSPIDDRRIDYSTAAIILCASVILYQFLTVYDRTRNEALEALTKSIEERDNLMHVVAHDLRNAVGVNLSVLELLEISLREGSAEETSRYVEILNSASSNALSIVDELRQAAFLERTAEPLRMEATDVAALARDVIDSYGPMANNKKISISCAAVPDDCVAKVDRDKVRRVIGNLISNAVKFTRPGGHIAVELGGADAHVRVSVKDDGIGIPGELQPELFKKHSKAGRRGTAGERSTGLGMYIVKSLLDMHGATIHLVSREDGGTELSFDLPRGAR